MTRREKRIFDYETVQSDPHEIRANNINPYLVDAPDMVIHRTKQTRFALFPKSISAASQ